MTFIVALATWANALILAFLTVGAGLAGKWWFPWMAEKVGKAAARGFHTEITTTSISAAKAFVEANVTPREAAQDEKIGHILDEVQLTHALALEAVTAGEVTQARIDDLVTSVATLQSAGTGVLAAHLEGQASFQRNLIDVLGVLVGRRTNDIPLALDGPGLPSDGIPTPDQEASDGEGQLGQAGQG